MIRIGICDDEAYMLDMLAEKVSAFFKRENMEITVFPFQSGKALLDCGKKLDIVFLDIQMGGPDGLDTAKELRSRGYSGFLIFVTVLRECVFNAFEVQAFDYLLKPIGEECFLKTMYRLLDCIKNAKNENLLIRIGYESRLIPFDDIVFCEVIDRKIYLNLTSGEVVDYYERIENLETKLDNRFYRCHRSYLINLKHLKGYKNGTAYMDNGREVPVSRLRSKEFSGVVLQYMKNM